MLELKNVTKYYPIRNGKRRVLHDISFTLRQGQRLGILGCNGAGKSTLIRIISGIELPTSGEITFKMSISWPLALQGAFVGGLTGLDNLRFVSRVYGISYKDALPFIEEFSGLGAYLREPIRTYSSGMRSRLAFAISMAVDFDCYMIDEVTAVGDDNFSKKCKRALLEDKNDRSLILVSHSPGVISEYCNCYSVLYLGMLSLFKSYDDAFYYYNDVSSRQNSMV